MAPATWSFKYTSIALSAISPSSTLGVTARRICLLRDLAPSISQPIRRSRFAVLAARRGNGCARGRRRVAARGLQARASSTTRTRATSPIALSSAWRLRRDQRVQAVRLDPPAARATPQWEGEPERARRLLRREAVVADAARAGDCFRAPSRSGTSPTTVTDPECRFSTNPALSDLPPDLSLASALARSSSEHAARARDCSRRWLLHKGVAGKQVRGCGGGC